MGPNTVQGDDVSLKQLGRWNLVAQDWCEWGLQGDRWWLQGMHNSSPASTLTCACRIGRQAVVPGWLHRPQHVSSAPGGAPAAAMMLLMRGHAILTTIT